MLHVALLRNVNVGQNSSPTTAQLLAAFVEAGLTDAQSFQSNGTVIFTASPDQARSLAQDAVAALASATERNNPEATSAHLLAALAERPEIRERFEETRFFCISAKVAAALPGRRVLVAEAPTEEAVLALLSSQG